MFKKYSLSVVLPAWNEEENIEGMVNHVISSLNKLGISKSEVIVVDDGSGDRTGEIIDRLESKYKGTFHAIHHEKNRGYAAALRTGFMNSKYPLVFYTDSDRQFDVEELRFLLKKIDDYDIVCGYRYKRIDPIQRIIIARIYNKIVSLMFGLNVRDADCAFRLFRRKILDTFEIESRGFIAGLEILSKAKRKGFKITEVPVTHYSRPAGSSTVTFNAIIKAMCNIIWLKKRIG